MRFCKYLRYVTRSIVLFTGNVVPSAQWPSSLIGRKWVRADVSRSSSGSGRLVAFCSWLDSLSMVTGLLHGTTGKKQLPVRGLRPRFAMLPRPPQPQGPSPAESDHETGPSAKLNVNVTPHSIEIRISTHDETYESWYLCFRILLRSLQCWTSQHPTELVASRRCAIPDILEFRLCLFLIWW